MSNQAHLKRVMVIKRVVGCSEVKANQAVSQLDKHDAEQLRTSTETSKPKSKKPKVGHVSFNDWRALSKKALVAEGFTYSKAEQVLDCLIKQLSGRYGGKRLYLPRLDMATK